MRERNIGWRLDYLLASAPLSDKAVSTDSVREFGTSDHAPVTAVFDVPIERAKVPDEPPSPAPAGQIPLL
jgi:Uri superfamily endonuclease